MTPHITFGLDASLGHGVLVRATWDRDVEGPGLIDFTICHQWQRKGVAKLHPNEITLIVQQAMATVPQADIFAAVGIDFDFDSVFFKGKAGPVMRVSFMQGLFYGEFIRRNLIPVHIRPAQLRERLGLKANTPKEATWEAANMPQLDLPRMNKDAYGDIQDAMILSYLVSR